jgi:prophage regulatory protein
MVKDKNLAVFLLKTDRMVRPREYTILTGLSKSSIWRLQKSGQFPKNCKLSAGTVGIKLSQIQKWLDDRESA